MLSQVQVARLFLESSFEHMKEKKNQFHLNMTFLIESSLSLALHQLNSAPLHPKGLLEIYVTLILGAMGLELAIWADDSGSHLDGPKFDMFFF